MFKHQKKLEALSELFESEKSYLQDLKFWGVDFKKFILNLSTIKLYKKYELVELIFTNIESIINLHQKIVDGMNDVIENHYCKYGYKREKYQKMEISKDNSVEIYQNMDFSQVYMKNLPEFSEYEKYVYRLPFSEYIIETEIENNKELNDIFNEYMERNKILTLGLRHYLFRPSQKLPRYPLLFNAILKNETDDKIRHNLEDIIYDLKSISIKVDKVFGKTQKDLKIYRIFNKITYADHVKNRLPLNLHLARREIIKVADLIVKIWDIDEPKLYRIILFDHILLICSYVEQNNSGVNYIYTDPIFLHNQVIIDKDIGYIPKNNYIANLHKLFLLERAGKKISIFFFHNISQKRLFFQLFNEAIENSRRFIDKSIFLEKESIISTTPVFYCAYSQKFLKISQGSNRNDEKENENKEDIKKEDNPKTVEKETNDSKNQNNESEISKQNRKKNKFYSSWIDNEKKLTEQTFTENKDIFTDLAISKEVLLISNSEGLFCKYKQVFSKIDTQPVKKVIYDITNSILISLIEENIYISIFTPYSDKINYQMICKNISNFFYGCADANNYIACVLMSNVNTSTILLYKINIIGTDIKYNHHRTLFIGSIINNIYFFSNKLLIACDDFEIIDINTLKTREFIDPLDPLIPYYCHLGENLKAHSIFLIQKNILLVCFNRIAFLVDNYGSSCTNRNVFLWSDDIIDLHVYRDLFLVLTDSAIHLWNITSGDLIYYDKIKNIRMVNGSNKFLFYDNRFLYKLKYKDID